MAKEIKLTWGWLVTLVTGVTAVATGISYLLTPHYNESFNTRYDERLADLSTENRIKEVAREFIYSPEVKLFMLEAQQQYEADKQSREKENIKLRTLLADKMNCDEDEVHIRLGNMYKDWKNNREKWEQN